MERLTERTADGILVKEDYGVDVLKTLYQCYGSEPMPHYANCDEGYCAVEKLAEYEDLEEQGKLLKLPCAVGDTVYEVQDLRKRIQSYTVIAVHVSNCGNLYGWELKDGKGIFSNINGFSEYALGKSVFLTKEEAEAALKELEGKKC